MKLHPSLAAALAVFTLLVARPAQAVPFPPKTAGEDRFESVAVLTLELPDPNNPGQFLEVCAVECTGPTLVKRGAPAPQGNDTVIPLEIISMNLEGHLPHDLPAPLGGAGFHVRAGMETLGLPANSPRATVGELRVPQGQPFGNSFFDVFFEIEIVGSTNRIINPTAVRVQKGINEIPPFNVPLESNAATQLAFQTGGQPAGTLHRIWHAPVKKAATKHKHGLSLNITGIDRLRKLEYAVCPSTRIGPNDPNRKFAVGALADLVSDIGLDAGGKPDFSAPIVVNLECDEVFAGVNDMFFEVKWTRDVRFPDWRGYHSGSFRIIRQPSGTTKPIVVAAGKLSGSHGVETHRPPLSQDAPARPDLDHECADCAHFEGTIISGTVMVGQFKGGQIRATYAGEYLDAANQPIACCPPPVLPPSGKFRMTIDGVVVTRCLPAVQ